MRLKAIFIVFLFSSSLFAAEEINEVEKIREVLRFGHSEQVILALKRLEKLEKEDQRKLIPDLRLLLNTTEPAIQKAFIDLLSKVEWNDLDVEVLAYFDSESSSVVIALLSHCQKKEIREVLPKVHEFLKETDYKVLGMKVEEMIAILKKFKDPQMVDFFYQKIQEEKTLTAYKIYMVRYFSEIDSLSKEIKEYLLKRVQDTNEDLGLRAECAYTLGLLKYEPAGEILNKELEKIDAIDDVDEKKKNFRYRLKLLAALTKMGDKNVQKVLISMTKSDDAATRKIAIIHLGELGNREFIDILEYKVKNDPSKGVREAAEEALKKIRGEKTEEKKEGE